MRAVILHIGDLHVTKDGKSKFTVKSGLFVDSLRSICMNADVCIIANTGDLTATGHLREFDHASKILKFIGDEIKNKLHIKHVVETHVPGNHDCYLPDDQEATRSQYIKTLKPNLAHLSDSHPLFESSLRHQEDFFKFEAQRCHSKKKEGASRLSSNFICPHTENRIKVSQINTSWLSQQSEKQGDLEIYLDDNIFESDQPTDLHIVCMHHPLQWLSSACQRNLHTHFTKSAHVILTGHEHQPRQTNLVDVDSNLSYIHLDGGVLSTSTGEDCSFEVLIYDTEDQTLKHHLLRWKTNIFCIESSRELSHLLNKDKNRAICLKPESQAFFEDLGMPIMHPRKEKLSLNDIFVFPDLEVESFTKESSKNLVLSELSSSSILGDPSHRPIRLIAGGEKSGKSSLLKMFSQQAYSINRFPIHVDANDIVGDDVTDPVSFLRKACQRLYVDRCVESLIQQPPHNLVILIDNWDGCRLNKKRRNLLLRSLLDYSSEIYLTCNQDSYINAVRSELLEDSLSDTTSTFVIKELGRSLKGDLIEKWLLLGKEHEYEEDHLSKFVDKTINFVFDVIGKNLLPHYAFFILSILSILESQGDHAESHLGTYGYHCEMLVRAVLSKAARYLEGKGKKVRLDTLIMLYGYISTELYRKESYMFTIEEASLWTNSYNTDYGMDVNVSDAIDAGQACGVIKKSTSDSYQFSYPLLRYYFLAKNLSAMLEQQRTQEEAEDILDKMVKSLNTSTSMGVVLQVVYFTKNEWLIARVLAVADSILEHARPVDLIKDTKDIMTNVKLGTLALDYRKSYSVKRQELDKQEDEAEAELNRKKTNGSSINHADEEELEEQANVLIRDIVLANRLVQVLGQIIRNFPGSLPISIKERILNSGAALALRYIKVLLSLYETNKDDLMEQLNEMVTWLQGHKQMEKVIEADRLYTVLVIRECVLGVMRIIRAFGSEELKRTYDYWKMDTGVETKELIELGIRMFHYDEFPSNRIFKFADKLDERTFPFFMIRLMSYNYMYLYSVPYRDRSRLCEVFHFDSNDPRMLSSND